MFSVTDSVENTSGRAVTLAPYALVARHGLPKTANYSVLHEGFVGVIGDGGVAGVQIRQDREGGRARARPSRASAAGSASPTNIGRRPSFRTRALPIEAQLFRARRERRAEELSRRFRRRHAKTLAPGASTDVTTPGVRRRQGSRHARQLSERSRGSRNSTCLIDWGWFYFITRPMFRLLDFLYKFTGNFGVAILIDHGDRQGRCSSRSPTAAIARWRR